MTRARRHASPLAEPVDTRLRACDQHGCLGEGQFRAPKGRDRLTEYYWFCLEHVRAYNLNWDYYRGMSPGEIERHVRNDTVWQRPTWPLGSDRNKAKGKPEDIEIEDPFDIFGEGPAPGSRPRGDGPHAHGRARDMPPEEKEALAILDLPPEVTMEELKARYKLLVKKHHPDANGGDRAAEERVKAINGAYSTLKKRLAA